MPDTQSREVEMQFLVLVGTVVMTLVAAVGTATLLIGAVLRLMSKLR